MTQFKKNRKSLSAKLKINGEKVERLLKKVNEEWKTKSRYQAIMLRIKILKHSVAV